MYFADPEISLKTTDHQVTEELYQALRSMTESYELTIQSLPRSSLLRSSVEGFFIGTHKPAEDAMYKYTLLKSRQAEGAKVRDQHTTLYMINLMKGSALK